ncbi:MAG: DNA-directed RNA polymerase subunit alpha [Phycisphaera sp. TMED151]|nr:MAG: DNA-directed RNA polymerase subunit alpha [Phycisphaera sp. TMED151]RZO56092.1 MAG: DNA-directed RNA polymerase subunit alpha [Phycisphaeraceae bacterium]
MTMHLKWRGLELPARVIPEASSRTETFCRFSVEPFERGFGTTVGNSLRRILLSSVEGAAVTRIRVKGAEHEFTTLPGVMEDVSDIVLNVKGLVLAMEGDEPRTIRVSVSGPGDVTGELVQSDANVEVVNKDHLLATLTDEIEFTMEMVVERGRGYRPASETWANTAEEDMQIGDIPVDAAFSPVERVRYRVENTRLGQRTNYERLILDVWTKSSLAPEIALVESAKILRKHLNPFVQYEELGTEQVTTEAVAAASVDDELTRKLELTIGEMDFSVRASNCLESGGVKTARDLVSLTEEELLGMRAFGRTSLREVKRRLEEMDLELGMYPSTGLVLPTDDDDMPADEEGAVSFSSDDLEDDG